jgi:flavodoxin I
MAQIGIFFGTDTGTTRLIAKKIAKRIGDAAAKPVNVNRITPDEMLAFDALILGTPTYGEGRLPGRSANNQTESWEEFLPRIADADLAGKTIALYGLGNQEKHGDHFASGLGHLYRFFEAHGATIVGDWPLEGYDFAHSEAVVDGRFAGLVIDQNSQAMLTEARLDAWLAQVLPQLGA